MKPIEWPVYVLAAYSGACRPITTFTKEERKEIERAAGIKTAKPFSSVCRFYYCGTDWFYYFSPEDGKAIRLRNISDANILHGIKRFSLKPSDLLKEVAPLCMADMASDALAAGGTMALSFLASVASIVMSGIEALFQAPKGLSVLMGNVELSYDKYKTTYGAAVHYFMCKHFKKENEFKEDPGLCLSLLAVSMLKSNYPSVLDINALPGGCGTATVNYIPTALGMAARFGALLSKFLR